MVEPDFSIEFRFFDGKPVAVFMLKRKCSDFLTERIDGSMDTVIFIFDDRNLIMKSLRFCK